MSVKETIEKLTRDGKFTWGVETIMTTIRPRCLYELSTNNGDFQITKWYDNWSEEKQDYIEAPTPQQLRDEYIRQKTIAECLEYFKAE